MMINFGLDARTISSIADGLWFSLIPSAVAAPFVYRALIAWKSRQTVSEYVKEHQAKQGTPTMGGIIVLIGMAAAFVTYRSMGAADYPAAAWLILLIGFGLTGFIDDYVMPNLVKGKRGLGWMPKLMMQFVVAFAALAGPYACCGLEVGSPWLVIGEALWIVAFSNAFNFSDGMDGLAGGLAVIVALSLTVIGILFQAPWWHTLFSMSIVGGMLPFLWFNAPPAKVFMGDVGSLPIGACLGWLAIRSIDVGDYSGPYSGTWAIAIGVLSLVMVLELVPVPLQILSVKLRKKRLFPMTPIHHAFQAAGWPETRVVAMFHLVQAVLAFAAISVGMSNPAIGGFVT